MSFLKDIIEKVEDKVGGHHPQNAPYSNRNGPWPQQGSNNFDGRQQEQYYGGTPFQGQLQGNHQRPPGPNHYQEGYGHPEYNQHQSLPPPFAQQQPPPYGNYGQQDMMHRSHSPRQFEESERGYHHHPEGHGHGYEHHHGHHEEHGRERSHSRERHEHRRDRSHSREKHGHHHEHRRERSHSRD